VLKIYAASFLQTDTEQFGWAHWIHVGAAHCQRVATTIVNRTLFLLHSTHFANDKFSNHQKRPKASFCVFQQSRWRTRAAIANHTRSHLHLLADSAKSRRHLTTHDNDVDSITKPPISLPRTLYNERCLNAIKHHGIGTADYFQSHKAPCAPCTKTLCRP